jgi:hypothetical protein
MTVRPFRDEDRKFLDNVSRETGYPYPNVDDHLTECIMIAEENGKPVAALLARRARCRRRALLPLTVWKCRNVGDSAARVRGKQNILRTG